MSHCAQLSSALSSLSSMLPPPTHIHSSGRDTALPPSAATMKKRPALLSPSSGEGAIFLSAHRLAGETAGCGPGMGPE